MEQNLLKTKREEKERKEKRKDKEKNGPFTKHNEEEFKDLII